MNNQTKALLKLTSTVILAAVAIGWVTARFNKLRRTGDENSQVWFYDQSEKRLYAAASDTIPPDKGIGGRIDDGVRAVVVAFGAKDRSPNNRRIAYLESYAPELKSLLEQVRTARASGQPFKGRIPSRDSDFLQTNTLVKLPDQDTWHPIASTEGRQIMSAWRAWRGPEGQPPAVCPPEP